MRQIVFEKKKMAMFAAPSTCLASVCFSNPASIGSTWISLTEWPYIYLITLGIVALGATIGLNSWAISIISLLVTIFLYWLLWLIMETAQWRRPPGILTDSPCVTAVTNYDAMNLYGAPDPVMTPVYIYLIFIIYMFWRLRKTSATWMLSLLVAGAFLCNTVTEFLLGRILVSQYFVNLSITIVAALLVILPIHYFYVPGLRELWEIYAWEIIDFLSYSSKKQVAFVIRQYLHKELADRKKSDDCWREEDKGDCCCSNNKISDKKALQLVEKILAAIQQGSAQRNKFTFDEDDE